MERLRGRGDKAFRGGVPLAAPPQAPILGIPSADSLRFEGDDAQAASFAKVVEGLKAGGAEIREIDFSPLYDIAEMLYYGPWVAERYAATESL
ncbi:MAG: allophanate hydrolase, partial [Pseudomonadota bacterium]